MIIINKYNIDFIVNVKSFPSNKTFIRQPKLNTNQTLFVEVAVKNRWEGTKCLVNNIGEHNV
jgi:hypothetical protein